MSFTSLAPSTITTSSPPPPAAKGITPRDANMQVLRDRISTNEANVRQLLLKRSSNALSDAEKNGIDRQIRLHEQQLATDNAKLNQLIRNP